MLFVTRKVGQTVLVLPPGLPPIEIVVNRLSGRRVTLGIQAAPDTKLLRGELLAHAGDHPPTSGLPTREDIAKRRTWAEPKNGEAAQ